MREVIEIRIPEEHAREYLKPDEGRRLGDSVRVLNVDRDTPQYEWIGDISHELQQQGEFFFLGWQIRRSYSRRELETAELFHLAINAVFEPAGEECGTEYDESTECEICGAGRTQVSELFIDLRKVPKNKDIAVTIADEWIVSQRLAELIVDARITGIELRPVHHKSRHQDDPVDPTKVPSGREILHLAEEAGAPFPTWEFYIWINRPEQRELAERVDKEYSDLLESQDIRRSSRMPIWYQIIVTSEPIHMVAPSRFGIHPFDEDKKGLYRCPINHVCGLNLLSEICVSRDQWDGSDIVKTKNMVGVRRGLLAPTPLLLISPKLRKLLVDNEIKGCRIEVAHLV
jgi:hypothetical protein